MKYFERSPFVPIVSRPRLQWPGGARLAVWVVSNVEYFREEHSGGAGVTTMRPPEAPDIANYTWRDYGPRVGFWRLRKILDEFGIPATVALNSDACAHYPEVVSACVESGWELMGHGRNNSEHLHGKSEAEERALIGEVLATIEKSTGKRPAGWLGPGLQETPRTLDILAELGVRYVADWVNDEQPHRLATLHGPLGAVPTSCDVNDLISTLGRGFTALDFEQMMRDQFDQLYEEGEETGKMMCIVLHPFIAGVPYRARRLPRTLAYMRGKPGVWFTTAGRIWDAYETATKPG